MIYVAVDKVGIAVLDNVPQGTEDREQWSVCQGSNVARMFLIQERMPRIGWESPQKNVGISPPGALTPKHLGSTHVVLERKGGNRGARLLFRANDDLLSVLQQSPR